MGNNKNDSTILTLKKQVTEKRALIKKSTRFSPVTNCSIEHCGQRLNIQVLTKDQLIGLLVELNALRLSAIDLDVLHEYIISGYYILDWLTDIKAKLMHLNIKEEERKLNAMEAKLEALLSNEKKVELELQDIADSLK